MNLENYKNYALFKYESNVSNEDRFKLGDVVIRGTGWGGEVVNEIGVIIQVHNKDEFRTDMFGNCCTDEIRLATTFEIEAFRPSILTDEK